MKKLVLLVVGLVLLGAGDLFSATVQTGKITNTRIVQAAKDTTLLYSGVRIFVPAGQTVILGQMQDGSVVVKGMNLQGVTLDDSAIFFQGLATLNYQPQTKRLEVARGESITVKDTNGRTAVLSQGAAVTASDIRTLAVVKTRVEASKPAAVPQAQQQEASENEIPAFVAGAEVSSAASEQAAQDVEETETVLSQSAR